MQSKSEPHSLAPLLDKLSYRADFSEAEKSAILDLPFTTRKLVRGAGARDRDSLLRHAVRLFHPLQARRQRPSADRVHPHEGRSRRPSELMLQTADHSVQMLTDSPVAMIPRQAVIDLTLEHPHIGHAMWIDTLVDGSIFREWITNIGRRQARERMAHLLCEFSLRLRVAGLGSDDHYELPMTQEQLADATGMTPVHVNRTIKTLEQEGLIERSNPRAIRIGDWRKLADAGDFDSSYLHLNENEPALA